MELIEKKGITSKIIINKDLVNKVVNYENYSKELLDREEYWLKKLEKYDIAPKFIERKDNSITMTYCGQNTKKEDFKNQGIQIQLINILRILIEEHCLYNDFKLDNFTIKKGKLYIIDFGWCPKIIEDYTCGGKIESALTKKPYGNVFNLFDNMKMNNVFLNKETYFNRVGELKIENPQHWKTGADRWAYHEYSVDILKKLNTDSILEAGTMGINLLNTSDTIDYDFPNGGWKLSYVPTYNHDLRLLPWPISNKQYDAFVALRVFHHYPNNAKKYFDEMKRISNHIILALPHRVAKIYKEIQSPEYEYVCKDIDTTILYWNIKKK